MTAENDVMRGMGFPDDANGPYVSKLRAVMAERVKQGLAYASPGSWSGGRLSHEIEVVSQFEDGNEIKGAKINHTGSTIEAWRRTHLIPHSANKSARRRDFVGNSRIRTRRPVRFSMLNVEGNARLRPRLPSASEIFCRPHMDDYSGISPHLSPSGCSVFRLHIGPPGGPEKQPANPISAIVSLPHYTIKANRNGHSLNVHWRGPSRCRLELEAAQTKLIQAPLEAIKRVQTAARILSLEWRSPGAINCRLKKFSRLSQYSPVPVGAREEMRYGLSCGLISHHNGPRRPMRSLYNALATRERFDKKSCQFIGRDSRRLINAKMGDSHG